MNRSEETLKRLDKLADCMSSSKADFDRFVDILIPEENQKTEFYERQSKIQANIHNLRIQLLRKKEAMGPKKNDLSNDVEKIEKKHACDDLAKARAENDATVGKKQTIIRKVAGESDVNSTISKKKIENNQLHDLLKDSNEMSYESWKNMDEAYVNEKLSIDELRVNEETDDSIKTLNRVKKVSGKFSEDGIGQNIDYEKKERQCSEGETDSPTSIDALKKLAAKVTEAYGILYDCKQMLSISKEEEKEDDAQSAMKIEFNN